MKTLLIALSLAALFSVGCNDKNEPILKGVEDTQAKCRLQIEPLKNFVINKKFNEKFLVSAVEQLEKLPKPSKDFPKVIRRFKKADFNRTVAADMIAGITNSKCNRSNLHQIFSRLLESAREMTRLLKLALLKSSKHNFLNPLQAWSTSCSPFRSLPNSISQKTWKR